MEKIITEREAREKLMEEARRWLSKRLGREEVKLVGCPVSPCSSAERAWYVLNEPQYYILDFGTHFEACTPDACRFFYAEEEA